MVALEVLTGHCRHLGVLVDPSTGWGVTRFPARAWCFEHASGYVLFDTGYAPRVRDAAAKLPYRAYGWVAPFELGPSAVVELARLGIAAEEVRTVVVSHLHADHIGGLRDFPGASVVVGRGALRVAALRGLAALRHGLLPDLLPGDLVERLVVIEDLRAGDRLGPFPVYDLHGDGAFGLVPLPGHASGQHGLLVGGTFYVADAIFGRGELDRPAALGAAFVAADARAASSTRSSLRRLLAERPGIRLEPSHDRS